MAKVEVISSCLVPMATNTCISKIELTPWDLQFLLLSPMQRGILFHKPESQELQKSLISHLKSTLSRTLYFFPPLAGRLGTLKNDDNTTYFFLDCNNAGVEFVHAIASAVSVSDVLSPTYIPAIVSSFFPLNELPPNYEGVSKPLFGVQVTELSDGLFIACTANHVMMDGTSFWHFLNSWSEISRGLDKISKIPIFERWFPSNINNYNIPLPPLERNPSQESVPVPPPLLERVFHFSKESVDKLKFKANSEAGTNKISTLQAVLAHLWRSVIRIQKSACNLSSQEEVNLLILIGARTRIPLPEGYFGNAVYGCRTASSGAELLQSGVGFAGMKINELVSQQTREAAMKFVEDWVKNPTIWTRGSISFVVASSPRHNVYGTDFGWGKPIAVRSGKAEKRHGKFTVYPTADPGGIDVEVCFVPETLHALEADAEFMEAMI